ncbi:MAG: hypothetical protein KF901_10480 [Myxococcales bacterium]|nr:hypothetical protein [Myxococcales bacterium]
MTRIGSLVGIVVTLASCAQARTVMCTTVAECAAGERCIDGRCAAARREDAGTDAAADASEPTDAGEPDAGFDAALDAGFDAGVDAGPPLGPCGVSPCAIYRLPAGATSWSAWPLGDGTFAPRSPVRAAFDLETIALAYVLTDSTYHVLRLADRQWIAEGPRDTLFPQAAGDSIRAAYTVPANHAGGDGDNESITLHSPTGAYLYSIRLSTRVVTYVRTVTMFSDAWSAPLAPSHSQLRWTFLDTANSRGWGNGNPSTLCGAAATTVGPYFAIGTATHTHLLEAGSCFEFYRREPNAAFPPFSMTGAPSPSAIGAAFWNQGGLWMLTE